MILTDQRQDKTLLHAAFPLPTYIHKIRHPHREPTQDSTTGTHQKAPSDTKAATMQHCDICGSDVKQRRIPPQNHDHEHGDDERACGQCWEAYISLQVEEKKPDEIECMFCKHYLGYDEVKSFAMAATNYRCVVD